MNNIKVIVEKKTRLRREITDIVEAHVCSDAGLDRGNMECLIDDIVATFSQEADYRAQEEIDRVKEDCERQVHLFKAHGDTLRNEIQTLKDKIAELKLSISNDSTKHLLESKLASEQQRNKALKDMLKVVVEGM